MSQKGVRHYAEEDGDGPLCGGDNFSPNGTVGSLFAVTCRQCLTLVENELQKRRVSTEEEAAKAMRCMNALEFLGAPDLSHEFFDAWVTHAAYKLGKLRRVLPTEKK